MLRQESAGSSPAIVSSALWYVIYVKARHEKRAYASLTERGIEAYLPMREEVHQWSDRKKRVTVPLFSCYVFVRTVPREFQKVYLTEGFVRFVSANGMPSVVRDDELEKVRRLTEEYPADIEVLEGDYAGREAEIASGPLAGLRGKIVELVDGKRFVVMIEGLNKLLRVKVPAGAVKIREIRS